MKLSEIKSLAESKMSERHADLMDAIMDEFDLTDTSPKVEQIVAYLVDNADSDDLDDYLYDHFFGEMPYGTQKARDGDPKNWIADRMAEIFKGKF